MLTMQSKLLVGVSEVFREDHSIREQSLKGEAAALNTGPLDQRLAYVVLVGELSNPKDALQKLRELNAKIANSDHEQEKNLLHVKDVLTRLYMDYERGNLDGPSVDDQDRVNLRATLGWFADLALAPAGSANAQARQAVVGSAKAVFIVFGIVLTLVSVAGFAGLIGLFVLVGFSLSGKLKAGVVPGSGNGGIYAETFALWMIVFLVFSFLAPQLIQVKDSEHLVTSFAFLASLVVLAWPVLRGGIPWRASSGAGNRPGG